MENLLAWPATVVPKESFMTLAGLHSIVQCRLLKPRGFVNWWSEPNKDDSVGCKTHSPYMVAH